MKGIQTPSLRLLLVRLQPSQPGPAQAFEEAGTPSLTLQPHRTGNIQTGPEAGEGVNTIRVFSASYDP